MAKTPVWLLPYPVLTDPADITGVDAVDDLANRLETVLSQIRASGSIPGEVKMWPGGVLPALATYGHWVWADGTAYASATYPLASGNIAAAWKTHAGKVDPGAGQFRVPDLRGEVPTGLDAMPGGARANRITRAAAATLAAVVGEEFHTLAAAEMPAHSHTVNSHAHGGNTGYFSNDHTHTLNLPGASGTGGVGSIGTQNSAGGNLIYTGGVSANHYHAVNAEAPGTNNAGSGGAHENLPVTVFVPWIVKLDD